MNVKVGNNLDFTQLQALNMAIHNLTGAPSSPVKGQKYFNTVSNLEFTYDGSTWICELNRAHHYGTQTASTISDFDTQVRTNRLDQLASPTASVSLNNQLITNLLNPVNNQDAATKKYVDDLLNGTDWKESVRVIAIADTALIGLLTIDGVTLADGDRVLVAGNTVGAQNGIYVASAGTWTRSEDANTSDKITASMSLFVEEGTTYADTQWRLTTNGTIVLGTTALTFAQIGAAVSYSAGTGLILTGNVFSVDFSIVPKKYSTLIGDGTNTSYTITHNLGTTDIQIVVKEVSTGEMVLVPYKSVTTNTATVEFAVAPATNTYKVIVIG